MTISLPLSRGWDVQRVGAACAQPCLWRLTSVTTIFPWVGLCPARNVLLWAFSSTDASVQVCTLPCSSYRVRVVDMLMLIHPLARACPVRPSNSLTAALI